MRSFLIVGCGLLAAITAAAASASEWAPLASAGARADGVWRSRGYGHLLVLRQGRAVLYHVAGPFCYRAPSDQASEDDGFQLARIISRRQIALAASADQTHYIYDRIASLPPACTIERRWTGPSVSELVAATFADLYAGFERRGRDVTKLTAALTTQPPGASGLALYQHLVAALDTLDDAHVGLQADIDGVDHSVEGGEAVTIEAARRDARLGSDPEERERAWSRRYRQGIVGLLQGGGHLVANRHVLWGRIGEIGYLNIIAMGAFAEGAPPDDTAALDDVLDEALISFAGLPAVIVDVTNNRGGYDAVSLHIAARFADRRRLAFTKRPIGAHGPFQRFYVTPSARPRYLGPVTLVTSNVTVSAGETFTLAMRALPNVRHVGARTRGALSDQLTKPLPNGWTLTLPAERYRDAAGRSQEGVGIQPVRLVPPFFPTHDAVIKSIAENLTAPR